MTEQAFYDYNSHKVAVIMDTRLDPAIGFRVLGHLGLALGAHLGPPILGRLKLIDANGSEFLGISKYPVVILRGKSSQIQRTFYESQSLAELTTIAFTQEMLDTGHDDELAAAMLSSTRPEILGIIFFGPSVEVNKVSKKFSLWRNSPIPTTLKDIG